jgi:hypothetical protein
LLTASELYTFLYGRTLTGKAYDTGDAYVQTFQVDGTVTSGTGFGTPWSGYWRIGENGHVSIIWNGHGRSSWGLRTDGFGRYFNSKSGVEVHRR